MKRITLFFAALAVSLVAYWLLSIPSIINYYCSFSGNELERNAIEAMKATAFIDEPATYPIFPEFINGYTAFQFNNGQVECYFSRADTQELNFDVDYYGFFSVHHSPAYSEPKKCFFIKDYDGDVIASTWFCTHCVKDMKTTQDFYEYIKYNSVSN